MSVPSPSPAVVSVATATATPRSAPPTPSDAPLLTTLLRPLATGWKPSGPTAIVTVSTMTSRTATLVAVPLGRGDPVPLIDVHDLSGTVPASAIWDARRDGSAIVFSVATGPTGHRLAIWDVSQLRAEWLTPEPRTHTEDMSPLWSRDERSVYFTRWGLSIGDQGVLHVGADGAQLPPIRGPSTAFGSGSSISAITSDGVLLGADEFNGPTPWVHDLETRRFRSLGIHNANVLAWRSARPRALVGVQTNIAAPGEGYVAVWDDVDGSLKRIHERPVGGGDFDPTGARVVISSDGFSSDRRLRLAVMDATGANGRVLEGTEDARSPRWLTQGILYLTFHEREDRMDVRLIPPSGGTARTLYAPEGRISRMRVVQPVPP